mmetsp:Transcript_12682/g.11240  ORF Transcript_12682/g.11240 Transcript_12682/m.11240 type:complete len:118 (+) Transcript_12682:1033-1386(+)
MIEDRDIHNSNFQNLITLMAQYEEGALVQAADGIADKLVIGNSLNPIYIETADDVAKKLQNPYTDYYLWLKEEIYNILALEDCLEGVESLRRQMEKLGNKKKLKDKNLIKLIMVEYL